MLKHFRSYMASDLKRSDQKGSNWVVKPKKVYFITSSGRLQKKHIALRKEIKSSDNKIIDEKAYQKIVNVENEQRHPGILAPFMIEENQYIMFASAGSLDQFPLSYEQAKIGFAQIINTLKYMHNTLHIVHADIKGKNIVLRDNGALALIDFDGVRETHTFDAKTQMSSTPLYLPPELHFDIDNLQKNFSPEELSQAADVWALAMTMIEKMSPEVFEEISEKLYSSIGIKSENKELYYQELYQYINKIESVQLRALLRNLLSPDVKKRVEFFANIEKDPFFHGINIKEAYQNVLVNVKKPPSNPKIPELKKYVGEIRRQMEELKKSPKYGSDKQLDYRVCVLRYYRNEASIQLAKMQIKSNDIKSKDVTTIPTPFEWNEMSTTHYGGLFKIKRKRGELTTKLDDLIERFHLTYEDETKMKIAVKMIRVANHYLDESTDDSSRVTAVADLLDRAIKYVDEQLELHSDWRSPFPDTLTEPEISSKFL